MFECKREFESLRESERERGGGGRGVEGGRERERVGEGLSREREVCHGRHKAPQQV